MQMTAERRIFFRIILFTAFAVMVVSTVQALPDSDQYRLESAQRLQKTSEIREAQIEMDRQRLVLANLDSEFDRIMGSLGPLPEAKLA